MLSYLGLHYIFSLSDLEYCVQFQVESSLARSLYIFGTSKGAVGQQRICRAASERARARANSICFLEDRTLGKDTLGALAMSI